MCGFTGIYNAEGISQKEISALEPALLSLAQRGPDHRGQYRATHCALAHARLAVIDVSNNGNQPFESADGRFVLALNGELFNYTTLREELIRKGFAFRSNSDTEVLLYGLISENIAFLKKCHGFFAFAFYDKQTNKILIARDRYGEKPLYWSKLRNGICFGSTLSSVINFPVQKTIDDEALELYLTLSYIPAPRTIIKSVSKVMPGEWISVNDQKIESGYWYCISPAPGENTERNSSTTLRQLLERSVEMRMNADVPVGTFLSGGIDSTIISGIAQKLNPGIKSFSIGFPDNKYFDETSFALSAARHIGTKHEVIPITQSELNLAIDPVLNNLSEPFGDSSSMVMYLLSKHASEKIKVALSGDGADEIFGGYNKHRALLRSIQPTVSNHIIRMFSAFLPHSSGSRNSPLGNKMRKLGKYAEGIRLSTKDRYFLWSSFAHTNTVRSLLRKTTEKEEWTRIKTTLTDSIYTGEMNEFLLNDIKLVLSNDMLVKVDQMSMACGLEVRSPFLDHDVVEFALSLPADKKLDRNLGKKILRATFRDLLPDDISKRAKHGFEIPLGIWIKDTLKNRIQDEWISENKIHEQGLFHFSAIKKLLDNPHAHAPLIWNLIVFQHWYNRYMK